MNARVGTPAGAAAPAGRVVVVGHGPAGHRLVQRLLALGHRGPVTVLTRGARAAHPSDAVDLRAGVRAVRIDRVRRLVHASDGSAHRYDTLVLATGARPAAGAPAAAPPAGPVAVVGGGEEAVRTALALRAAHRDVTLVHREPQLLGGHLDPAAAELLGRAVAGAGIRLRPGRTALQHAGGRLALDDGESLPATAVLRREPPVPETALARAAGLAVGRGIAVDARLLTSDPRIHALGACTGPGRDGWAQADALARLLTGTAPGPVPERPLLRLSAAGVDLLAVGTPGDGDLEVLLRDPARGRYARLGLRDGRIASAVVLGLPRAIAAVTQLYDRDLPVPADRLALLLGTPAALPGGAEPGPDTVLCHCAGVTRGAVAEAWHAGACDVPALAAATRATTGCGGCGPDLRALCASLARASAAGPARPRELADQPA
ncbi:FAD-dependent oxidoreductase [Kitasatospora terrestris]|uniref:FAD-dependent oxidoreductase n=1 Tax=Kitasatospora terrestris TaxID=258051 RepID=A0ABP9DVD1_9ACTN